MLCRGIIEATVDDIKMSPPLGELLTCLSPWKDRVSLVQLVSVSRAGTFRLDSDHALLFALATKKLRGRFTNGL